jgi:DNA-binding LacI/PurR family transcriptional regulator
MGRTKKRARLADVAKAAGESLATVSRVASGAAFVDPQVQERVRKAAGRLDFDLTRKRPKMVALLLSNRQILHPYHSHILSGAEGYCSSVDYGVLFLSFRYDGATPWRELKLPKPLDRHDAVSGFIVAGTNSANLLALLAHRRVPFVVLGDNVLGEWKPEACDVVWSDDVQGAYEMTRHLQSQGHTQIGFIGNSQLSWFARRRQGYVKAMEDGDLSARIFDLDLPDLQQMGYLAAKSLLAEHPGITAIFAAADLVAEGVFRALRDLSLRIGEHVSVAGFNDIEAPVMHPPLTSVRQFPELVGRRMAQMIIARTLDPALPPQHAVVPTQLVRRQSTGPARAQYPGGQHASENFLRP